jgi:hypothetical protein
MSEQIDPSTVIEIVKNTQASIVGPMRREPGPTYNSRALIDACKPFDWIDEFPEVVESDPEYIDTVRKKWRQLFDGLRPARILVQPQNQKARSDPTCLARSASPRNITCR